MMIENFDVDSIKFDDNGLVVAIAADAVTNEVLMQAYMDRVALVKTLETHEAHYYSRSRKKLWRKGETSGHVQKVVSIMSDCDNDSILLRVLQTGAACHTGKRSCFFNNRVDFDDVPNLCAIKDELVAIRDRQINPKIGSYTNYLFDKGKEKICKKIGEEASECIIAAMKGDNSELANEVNDLLYHLFVLLENQKVDPINVLSVMQDRRNKPRKREY